MTLLLAVASVLLLAAAAREAHGAVAPGSALGSSALGRRLRSRAAAARLGPLLGGLERRIERAGLTRAPTTAAALTAKLACGLVALPAALALAPAAPGRLGLLLIAGLPLACFWLPDLLLERAARRRAARLTSALPDSLDVMAMAAAAGRGVEELLAESASAAAEPLRGGLRATAAEIACGCPRGAALERLRERADSAELAAVIATLERSRRHGSPLAPPVLEQAEGLREAERRGVGERAARAAPKMQLAVALLLVPSVLLILAAAILANAGVLLEGL
jgi:tight adherence protein C